MNHLEQILYEVAKMRSEGRPILAIFDLDSTLFDLTPRQRRIVESFVLHLKTAKLFSEESKLLKKINILASDWGLDSSLGRLGLGPKQKPEFFQALHAHWIEHFFSDRFLLEDDPLPGAVDYVQQLFQMGANIVYLTGRDKPRMGAGTIKSLKHWGFPLIEPKAQLVLKPKGGMDDADFKMSELRQLHSLYERIWFFENEPVNLNRCYKEFPEIELIMLETTHSQKENAHPDIVRVPHFTISADVLANFRKKT